MRGNQNIYNSIVTECNSFISKFNRADHEEFPKQIVEFLTIIKDLLCFDMILVVQPLMMDNRLESFVSGPGQDYSSLGLLRNMDYTRRAEILNGLIDFKEFSKKNGESYPMFDANIFNQVVAVPINNIETVSELNGGIFFLNKTSEVKIDDKVEKAIKFIGEIVSVIFNSYRKNQLYLTSYAIFQSMQQSSGSAVCVYSPRGVIVFNNKYFTELTGCKESEMLKKNILDVLPLQNHNTIQDYHFYSDDAPPKLLEDKEAKYCKMILPDGGTVPFRKYCTTLNLERKKYWMIVLEDIAKEIKNIDTLEMSGFYDNLTALGNRNLFQKDIGSLFLEEKLPVAAVVGDVNGLKLMNDIFGHDYGDHMLKKIAEILHKNCENGSLYRVGGDEFYLFINNSNEVAAREIIEKINDDCFSEFKELNFIGISLGYSIVNNSQDNIAQIIRKAESDMYYIKSMSSENIKNASIASLKKIYQERYTSEKERTDRLIKLAKKFGPHLNLRDSEIDDICNSIELIDIGKVSVSHFLPDSGPVAMDDEFENMKKHCWIGYKIAALSYETSHLARVILNHHENWDGTGFPQGIKGNAIPFLSRVIRVMAYYDGLVNTKQSLSMYQIINELEVRKSKLFDPVVTDSFLHFLKNKAEKNS